LVNHEDHPEALAVAAAWIARRLAEARRSLVDPGVDPEVDPGADAGPGWGSGLAPRGAAPQPPPWETLTPAALAAATIALLGAAVTPTEPAHSAPGVYDAQERIRRWQEVPLALLPGCWLQGQCAPTVPGHGVHLLLLRAFFAHQRQRDGLAPTLRTAAGHGLGFPPVTGRAFAEAPELSPEALALAAFAFGLGLLAETFQPEGLGFHLLASVMGLPDGLLAEQSPISSPKLAPEFGLGSVTDPAGLPVLLGEIRATLARVAAQAGAAAAARCWERIQTGHAAGAALVRSVRAATRARIAAEATPAPDAPICALAALVQARAGQGRGLHGQARLLGRPVDDWLAEAARDPWPLLRALRTAGWIRPEAPAASSFLVRLLAFGGPMFGVFNAAEEGIWRAGIGALGEMGTEEMGTEAYPAPPIPPVPAPQGSPAPPARPELGDPCTVTRPEPGAPASATVLLEPVAGPVCLDPPPPTAGGPGHKTGVAVADPDPVEPVAYAVAVTLPRRRRERFPLLLQADTCPAARAAARVVAEGYLRPARRLGPWLPAHLRPFPWAPAALAQRVELLYRRQCDRPRPPVPPCRLGLDGYRFLLTQLAPAALIDGAWLARVVRPGAVGTLAVGPLAAIHRDELGGGDPRRHHPNIYRALLADLGVELPPVAALAFAASPSLHDAAFAVPLVFLSFAAYPRALLPECLGLNLAIELSGLGQGYLRLADELRHYGIDPYFFLLHLAIDNPGSGHTALAQEAICLYLDEVTAAAGGAAAECAFQRVWTGFLAFRLTLWRTGPALLLGLLPGLLPGPAWTCASTATRGRQGLAASVRHGTASGIARWGGETEGS
jgi:hypothetical protein